MTKLAAWWQSLRYGHRWTIRSSLMLLVMACMVPGALLAVALITLNYQREHERLVRDSIGTARAMTQAIDRDLATVTMATTVLATSPALQAGDLVAFQAQASAAVREHVGDYVVLSDASGQELVNTLLPPGSSLPRRGDVGPVRRVFATGRPALSDVYIGAVGQRPIISFDVPVFRFGRVVYDLSVISLAQHFAKVLFDQRLPPTWVASVFDSSGTIVARTHEMDRYKNKKGTPALVKRMAEVREDALETRTLEGTPVLAVFSRSAESNWAVAIGIPTEQLNGELRSLQLKAILGGLLVLLISLASAVTIGGRIARAIRGLSGPALSLGFGGTVIVPDFHLKEADEVGQALLKASTLLQDAQHRANHDALTSLANRTLFCELLDQQLAVCRRTGASLAVLFLDLDGFKKVNDTHGHRLGDELLRAVTSRLKNGIRPSDVAARLGGDEFSIMLINTHREGGLLVARKLAESLAAPYTIFQERIEISASIGVAPYPESGTTSDELLHWADEAMYKAKVLRKRPTENREKA